MCERVCACVCVCESEREREREWLSLSVSKREVLIENNMSPSVTMCVSE